MRHISFRCEWLILSLAVLLGLPSVSLSQDAVPINIQAAFLLKALSRDRNLKKRSSGTIRIAVLYNAEKDRVDADKIADAFNEAGKDKVSGLPVETVAVQFKSVGDFLQQIVKKKFNTLYIHPSMNTALSSAQQIARGKKIPSMGNTKKVVEQGVSLGVYLVDGAPKLVVNLRASKVEGLALSADLLRVSTIVK